ncbi:hypothetical protein [Undibacterium sp. Ren11W]|uniref:hypothetical protein n=1 Tax=Undibacterium sp. Ren11W TaxID=3413045 RepID=UPI003BEF55A7
MFRFNVVLTAFLIVVLNTGCSVMAPQYNLSVDNVQLLKNSGTSVVKVGEFSSKEAPGNANPISIRGSSLSSPYQNSYANYLAEALKQELTIAKKISPNAISEISGVLLKNDIDASVSSVGSTTIEARFFVKQNGKVSYDQVKSIKHEFPSAFAGAVALPKAIQEYTFAVQKLLALLYSDAAFVQAIK